MLTRIGDYFIFLGTLFRNREKMGVYLRLIIDECMSIGVGSIFIVALVNTFIGAVTCVQTAYNLTNPFVPKNIIALIVRDSSILELAPTLSCIVLAGKVGSNIAGELGTMRISEQIDALEVMGINSSSYLILPKVVASVLMFPLLVIMAAFLSILGGYIAGTLAGVISPEEYVSGLRFEYKPFGVTFALIKTVVFAFLVSTISAYQGYNVKGGALEVGTASTSAVTNSCIAIVAADFVLTQVLLT
ncbi:phospholipid/cholesterol/gamma-HCH transport system permease protein [Spirosoma oryzae]|uniref:Phospholipid/cholesterol/gamma-HCH transport system permease protein n=1 Tax=Spirosoma oryzae TaxID=1469603 RepID=A0A2T0SSZ0_9BACT|nr:ABC transporter permease [Spirosoma oryzae]PRY36531.1 phospholipid/cholesterol/gamma-HCH transport system permease protein [Spirosoma oryzae]